MRCVPRLWTEWVSCLHHPSIFWNSFQETEITTISQMMQAAMSSNSFAIAKSATAKLKMKMLPAGLSVALCNTAIQFSDRHSHRSFLLLRIADFVVDAVDVVDVSVSEVVAFPPGEHLACSGITYTLGIIVSSLVFLLHKVFLSFLSFQRNLQLGLRMIFSHSFCTNLPKPHKCRADLQKSPSFITVESGRLFAMFFAV